MKLYKEGDKVWVVKGPWRNQSKVDQYPNWTPVQGVVTRNENTMAYEYFVRLPALPQYGVEGSLEWGIDEDQMEMPFMRACREALK